MHSRIMALGLAIAAIAVPAHGQAVRRIAGDAYIHNSDLNTRVQGSFTGFGRRSYTANNGSTVSVQIGPANGGFIDINFTGDTEGIANGVLFYTVRLNGTGATLPDGTVRVLASTRAITSNSYGFSTAVGLEMYPWVSPADAGPYVTNMFSRDCEGPRFICESSVDRPGGWNIIDQELFLVPNIDYQINLYASVRQQQRDGWSIRNGYGGTPVHGTARAYVDPTFTIDPSFSGFAMASSLDVPEPESWALLIAGFGLVGAAARRQRREALSPRLPAA